MADGLAKNLQLIWRDIKAIVAAIRTTRAEQSGWTHEYMQAWRTACRVGPVAVASLCGIGGPLLALWAIYGWLRYQYVAEQLAQLTGG